jgi:hypothetical protein
MARALENWSEPVSTTVNGGLHSVIVSGVWPGNDPNQNWPAAIQGLVYRDPEGSETDPNKPDRMEVSYTQWQNGWFSNPFGTYGLWNAYYGNIPKDPEPSVVGSPYTPAIGQTHWFHGFNWVQRDNNYSNGQ